MNQGYNHFKRYACKMATGSRKTTVMGMLSPCSILNKIQNRNDARFSDVVLVVCPNTTIRNRLQELDPNQEDTILISSIVKMLIPKTIGIVSPDLIITEKEIQRYHTVPRKDWKWYIEKKFLIINDLYRCKPKVKNIFITFSETHEFSKKEDFMV